VQELMKSLHQCILLEKNSALNSHVDNFLNMIFVIFFFLAFSVHPNT
jgi:hypothetical protein